MASQTRSTKHRLLPTTNYVALRTWLPWLTQKLLGLAALYVILFLLLLCGWIAEMTRYPDLRLDVMEQVDSESLRWTGSAPPGSQIEVFQGWQGSIVASGRANPRGRFELFVFPHYLDVTSDLMVRAVDPKTSKVLSTAGDTTFRRFLPPPPPTLEIAYYVADSDLLWLAGRGEPSHRYYVQAPDDQPLAPLSTDPDGNFDALIDIRGTDPEELTLVDPVNPIDFEPLPIAATETTLANFPVARKTEIYLARDRIEWRVTLSLPTDLPLFKSWMKRYLHPNELVRDTMGLLPLGNDTIASTTVSGKIGTIVLESSLHSRFTHFFPTLTAGHEGLASAPLLTSRDEIELHVENSQFTIFGEPLPDSWVDGVARWSGPKPHTPDMPYIGYIQSNDPTLVRESRKPFPTADEESKEEDAEKFGEFLKRIEQQVPDNPVKWIWQSAILLIPFVGFFLIGTHRRTGPVLWRYLLASTLILGTWHCWYFFFRLLLDYPGRWLRWSVVHPVLNIATLGYRFPETTLQRLSDLQANAFWLIFIAAVGSIPSYLNQLAAMDYHDPLDVLGAKTRATEKRSAMRRAGATLGRSFRGIWGFSFLSTFLIAVWWREIRPLDFFLQFDSISRGLEVANRFYEESHSWIVVATPFVFALSMVAFGLRATLFSCGLLLVFARSVFSLGVLDRLGIEISGWPEALFLIPTWIFAVLAGLSAWPLITKRVSSLLPGERAQKTPSPSGQPGGNSLLASRISAALIAGSLLVSLAPPRVPLVVASALLFMGIGWICVRQLNGLRLAQSLLAWMDAHPTGFLSILGLTGIIVGWAIPESGVDLRFSNIISLVAKVDGLFGYILVLGIMILLMDRIKNTERLFLTPSALLIGAYLFAIFLANSSRTLTWLFIPVPFLVALLIAKLWLFRPMTEIHPLRNYITRHHDDRRTLIANTLDASSARSRVAAVLKTLQKKFDNGEISPEDYDKKVRLYQKYRDHKLLSSRTEDGISWRSAIFGVGSTTWENTLAALKIGSLLAIGPIIVALYEYLPKARVSYPFPIADLFVFLISAAAPWLLYAVFFGYFFPHLRGTTGLGKGVFFSIALAVPFGVYQLLNTPTLKESVSFVFWVFQVFVFCSLLGLLAIDLRMLRDNDFSGWELRVVHNVVTQSTYASSILAALSTTLIAVLTGRLNEVVTFFLDNVLPRVSAWGP